MKNFDNSFLNEKISLVAGVDEAGRGPLAGPVVSAAVVFDCDTFIEGVNDSKKLSEKEREKLYPEIMDKALSVSVAAVSHGQIDRINILQASLSSMLTAVKRLGVQPDIILVDGDKAFHHSTPALPIVKGDSKSFAIASASIIAKVTRDRIMKRLNEYYPEYLWAKNKGYPTRQHIEAVKAFGPCPLHRKSFLRKILSEEYMFEL